MLHMAKLILAKNDYLKKFKSDIYGETRRGVNCLSHTKKEHTIDLGNNHPLHNVSQPFKHQFQPANKITESAGPYWMTVKERIKSQFNRTIQRKKPRQKKIAELTKYVR